MGGLQVGGDSVFAQGFRRDWADRPDHRAAQSGRDFLMLSHLIREPEQMMQLDGRRKQHDLEVSAGEIANRPAQRLFVFWRSPLVNWHGEHLRSAFCKSRIE